MATFRTAVHCGSHTVTVESDDYLDFHRAVASLVELDRAAEPLRALGAEDVVFENHRAGSYEYFGFIEPATGRAVSFGQATESRSAVPFFPKPDEGVYDPATKRREPVPVALDASAQPRADTPRSERPHGAERPAALAADDEAALPVDDGELVRTVTEQQAQALRRELKRNDWPVDAARLLLRHFGAETPEDLDESFHAAAMASAGSAREQLRWTQEAQRLRTGEATRPRAARRRAA